MPILSAYDVRLEDISDLVGPSNTSVPETVYRHEIRRRDLFRVREVQAALHGAARVNRALGQAPRVAEPDLGAQLSSVGQRHWPGLQLSDGVLLTSWRTI